MRFKSAVFTIARGSLGGITFLSGPGNALIARQRVSPVQPTTNARTIIRAALSAAVAVWDALTDAIRLDWKQYAATVTYTGPLGPYHPSGRQLAIGQYVQSVFLREFGTDLELLVPKMDPPLIAGQLAAPGIIIAPLIAGTGFSVQIENTDATDILFYVEGSLAQSNSRNYFKGPFIPQTVQSLEVATASIGAIDVETPAADRVHFVKIRGQSADGPRRMTPTLIVRAISSTTV